LWRTPPGEGSNGGHNHSVPKSNTPKKRGSSKSNWAWNYLGGPPSTGEGSTSGQGAGGNGGLIPVYDAQGNLVGLQQKKSKNGLFSAFGF
jgi:hypothetical protein